MRAPGFWWSKPGLASAVLSPLATLYGGIAERRLTQGGTRVGIPVICVGNPTVGGAGKTPAAIAIAQMLIAAGERPMFLTRGYGGQLTGPVTVASTHNATAVGDEPLLLARIAPTVVAHDRVTGAKHALAAGASVIVMDDGFQNPSLVKDLSILAIDGTRGIGNGKVLPAGPLRAPLGPQLGKANAVLVVGTVTGAVPQTNLPLFHARLTPDPSAVAALAGKKVLAFAGIGDPEKFFATVVAAGIEAPVRRAFGDHHRYSVTEATALLREAARENLTLLTTEKDFARLAGDASVKALAERAQPLPVALTVTEDDAFRRLVLGVAGR